MLRLHDTRTGQAVSVAPSRGRELRIATLAPGLGRPGVVDVRRLLLADLIRRTVQMHRVPALTWWDGAGSGPGAGGGPGAGSGPGAGGGPDAERALLADCAELNIHPPGGTGVPGRPADIWVAGRGDDPAGAPGCQVEAGQVEAAGDTRQDEPVVPWLASLGLDPLCLRLALLRCRYHEPVTLTAHELAETDAALRAWRWLVAGWAAHPSRPMSAPHAAAVLAALDDDLATPAAIEALDGLAADDTVPPGARFETFAHLDQLLGLDLAREVGRAPQAGS